MSHCNPAPPHPEPGQVFNVICPPSGETVAVAVFVALVGVAAMVLIARHSGDSSE